LPLGFFSPPPLPFPLVSKFVQNSVTLRHLPFSRNRSFFLSSFVVYLRRPSSFFSLSPPPVRTRTPAAVVPNFSSPLPRFSRSPPFLFSPKSKPSTRADPPYRGFAKFPRVGFRPSFFFSSSSLPFWRCSAVLFFSIASISACSVFFDPFFRHLLYTTSTRFNPSLLHRPPDPTGLSPRATLFPPPPLLPFGP